MVIFSDDYINSDINAEIPADGVIHFCQTQKDIDSVLQFGSFNTMLLQNNNSQSDIQIRLNGMDIVKFKIPAKNAGVIKADHSKRFNYVEVTNLDSVNAIPAGDVSITYSIARRVATV